MGCEGKSLQGFPGMLAALGDPASLDDMLALQSQNTLVRQVKLDNHKTDRYAFMRAANFRYCQTSLTAVKMVGSVATAYQY